MKKAAISLLTLLGVMAVGIVLWNHTALQRPLDAVLAEDPRNEGVKARAHFRGYVKPHEIVFDLRLVGADKAPIEVFRVLLQSAERLQDRRFERVVLAHRGVAKFQLEGTYFQKLGREYSSQNPVYTARTFPEHLLNPDGTPAFGQWSGGLLGVMKEQMKDFMEFHKGRYLNDMISEST